MDPILIEKLRHIVKEEKAWSGVPGVTMALIHGKEEATICEGFRNREAALPVTPHTRFVIASCSKSMTTAMLARLVEEGILDWDRPVRDYAPKLQMKDPIANAHMSLRDMCLHRTGLADHDGLWPDPEGREALAARLRFIEPNLPFRQKYQYNNVIYALTAYVAECATGKSYEQLMKEYLLEPLGMRDTLIRFEEQIACEDAAEPYYYRNEKEGIVRQERWNMDPSVAAASIATDAVDMLKWLHFNVSGASGPDGKRLISQESWDVLHRAGIPGREDTPRDFAHYDGYGFGWWEGSYRGHAIYKHTGKINGFSSVEILVPDLQVGIFVSQNLHVPEKHLYYRAAYTALDSWLGIPEAGKDWEDAYHGSEPCSAELYTSVNVDLMPERKAEPTPPSLPAEAYAGVYEEEGYGKITVCMKDGKLELTHLIYRCPLTHYDGDIFRAEEFWEDVKNITMPLQFIVEPGNTKPSGLVMPMEVQVAPIHFRRKS